MAITKGVDCAVPLTAEKAKAMAAAGMRFACRYLVPAQYAWKRLTRAEAEAITAAGLKIVSVFQRGQKDAAGGAANGTRDGKAAYQEAKAIGQLAGTAIYFAVDFDAQPKDYDAIEAYLRAAAKELPGYNVGVYGSYAVVEEMARRGAAKHFWQTYAWSRGKISKCANLYQYKNGQTLAGHTVDFNESYGNEGWWDTNPQKQEKPVNKPVEKQADTTTQEALKVLQAAGVIQTPEYWIQNAHEGGQVKGEYAALLIQNMAKRLSASPTPQPQPKPVPEPQPQPNPQPEPSKKPERPVLSWEEVKKLVADATVYVDVGGGGSGVILPNGYLLSARHVCKGRGLVAVKTRGGRWIDAHLVEEHPNPDVDLALYRLATDPSGLPALVLSAVPIASDVQLVTAHAQYRGDWVVKSGASNRTAIPYQPWEFDHTVPVEPGNSGGVLANQYGELVGIVVQRVSVKGVPGGEAVNVAHPIVADWLKQFL
jgi:hypothetical protein